MRPENIVRQPSASIFNGTLPAVGVCVAAAACLPYREGERALVTIPLAGLGIGMAGAGVFPGTYMTPHQLFALPAFTAGGVGAILASRGRTGPLRAVHAGLGAVALLFLVAGNTLMDWGPVARLGEGGVERWIVYPVVLWLVVLGTGLVAGRASSGRARPGSGRAPR